MLFLLKGNTYIDHIDRKKRLQQITLFMCHKKHCPIGTFKLFQQIKTVKINVSLHSITIFISLVPRISFLQLSFHVHIAYMALVIINNLFTCHYAIILFQYDGQSKTKKTIFTMYVQNILVAVETLFQITPSSKRILEANF